MILLSKLESSRVENNDTYMLINFARCIANQFGRFFARDEKYFAIKFAS